MRNWFRFIFAFSLIAPLAQAEETVTETAGADQPPLVSPANPPTFAYPQRREFDGYTMILHTPQIVSWKDFKNCEALVAVELTPPDGSAAVVGSVRFSSATSLDMQSRIVTLTQPVIEEVKFSDASADEYEDAVKKMTTRKNLDVPLDIFLAYLADDVLSEPPPKGFNTAPPPIYVAQTPTLLLFVNGKPVLSEVADSGINAVVNANWPVFQNSDGSGDFYLVDRALWLSAASLDGDWKPATSLPDALNYLPDSDQYAKIKAALPLQKTDQPVPQVIHTDRPGELIVTEGEPALEAISGADGLEYVTNTRSPLFRDGKTWYFLVAGRWFTTSNLSKGPWKYTHELPAGFSSIPDDHAMASVLASVPGTVEAKMASLEALLPTTKKVDRSAQAPVDVTYAGDPKFEPIPDTKVSRAVNSGYDVIHYLESYYLCYQGVWYQARAPIGPWEVAASVPDAIYAIPPSSPVYNVTQVKVVESTPAEVIYTYPPSYSSSIYVVYGVPYYGTGWYYPPYLYGGYYYPYWGSYGHGSWYNPATGAYGSRSVWYGPYGGYSYSQGYNPRTGRYGYMETGWDNDEWASNAGTYNPRTGVSTETSRYYDEDKNKSQMNRTVERGDQSVTTERDVNWGAGTSQTKRETSGGASSNIKRQYEDGTATSSGTIKTADGRSFNVEGEQDRFGGNTTITGDNGSADLNTQRGNGRSVTSIDGSQGGQGVSVSGQGPGRTTVGQSSSGDLYAGHDGNVYKKTDDGWQKHENGSWNPVDTPQRADGGSVSLSQYQQQRQQNGGFGQQGEFGQRSGNGDFGQRGGFGGSSNLSQLNRDYSARQMGNRQFQQRAGGFSRGGFGGGRFGGGGGFRRR